MNSRLTSDSSTSQSLLRKADDGDKQAWFLLVELYGPLVYSWCRKAGVQDQDAADITQEVLLSLTKGLKQFDSSRPGSRFRSYLAGITHHKIKDYFRRIKNRAVTCDWLEDDLADGSSGSPVLAMETQYLANRALELIQVDFENKTWQAFWRSAVNEEKPAEIAADLGMSVSSVYTARSRVLSRLRTELHGLI